MKAAVAITLLLVAACNPGFTSPDVPGEGVLRFDPPREYYRWWDELAEEAEIPAPFPMIGWYEVAGGGWMTRSGQVVFGLWFPQGRIYIAEGRRLEESTIKHEMLHELLQGDMEHMHPLFGRYGRGATG